LYRPADDLSADGRPQDGLLDDPLEFADVPRPRPTLEVLQHVGGKARTPRPNSRAYLYGNINVTAKYLLNSPLPPNSSARPRGSTGPAPASRSAPGCRRKALDLPALTATRFNPLVAAFHDRLVAAAKPKMAAVGACLRKLLMIACGVLKSRTPFDPARASKITPRQHTIWFGVP
jgi:hypothetical protein